MKTNKIASFIIAGLMVLQLVFYPNISSAAEVKDDIVSKEEFTTRLQDVFKKHNSEIEFENETNYEGMSRKEFEAYLKQVDENLSKDIVELKIDEPSVHEKNKGTRIMPIDITHTGTFLVTSPLSALAGSATFRYTCYAEYDAQGGKYMTISPRATYYSAASNVQSVRYNSDSWSKISGGTQVRYYCSGTVTFGATVAGVYMSGQKPFEVTRTFSGN